MANAYIAKMGKPRAIKGGKAKEVIKYPADEYEAFLATKKRRAEATGFACGPLTREGAEYQLFLWQQHVVRIAILAGKFALFEDCGLGKSGQQLIWSDEVCKHTRKPVLILCPLAVAAQTVSEGVKFGVKVTHIREAGELGKSGIFITNYDRLEKFLPDIGRLGGVVLDESSLLKSFTGKTRIMLTQVFTKTQYKLCCTATPAPNDYTELGQHAEFLSVMTAGQMLATWFINDTADTGTWRLKKHARADFWRWAGSWAACISKPSDIGFSDDGYDLPPLELHNHSIAVDEVIGRKDGELFRATTVSATNLHREARFSMAERCELAVSLALETTEPAIIWCELNDESKALADLLIASAALDYVEIVGSDKAISKENKLGLFATGEKRYLVTKPEMGGFGMNFQHCRKQIFVGQSWSMEDQYQAIKRSHRFGQTSPVHIHFITPSTLGDVRVRVREKFAAHDTMKLEMKEAAKQLTGKKDGQESDAGMETIIPEWICSHGNGGVSSSQCLTHNAQNAGRKSNESMCRKAGDHSAIPNARPSGSAEQSQSERNGSGKNTSSKEEIALRLPPWLDAIPSQYGTGSKT